MFGDDMTRDYSCSGQYFQLQSDLHAGKITEDKWRSWYDAHCRDCRHASDICMYGEPVLITPVCVRRALGEKTKKQNVLVGGVWYALHVTRNREVLVTDADDFSKVYALMSLDFYKRLAEYGG